MPFTPSHAVVALPFLRSPLWPGAVAVGAMTPDFPLFFDVGIRYAVTHSFPGLILVSLPLAFVLFVVWRVLLRPVTAGLVPRGIGQRLPVDWNRGALEGWKSLSSAATGKRSAAQAVLLVVSLGIGVATHVLWDLFTHVDRWGSELIPAIGDRWGPLPGHAWLQHASSVFGLAVLAWWAIRWLRHRQPTPVESRVPSWLRFGLWAAIPLCLVGAVAIELALGINRFGSSAFAFTAGTNAGAAILVAIAVAALAAHRFNRGER